MAKRKPDLGVLLGATRGETVSSRGGGAFGMARLAQVMHQRLTPSSGERPGRPTDVTWSVRPKVPMSKATHAKLKELAAQASSNGRKVSAMQLAAHLLEEAVENLQAR